MNLSVNFSRLTAFYAIKVTSLRYYLYLLSIFIYRWIV